MGKEWLNWVDGGRGRFSGRRGKMTRKLKDAATSVGCMCTMFQLLHFQTPSNHDHHMSKAGVEAPRNSLELNEPPPPPAVVNAPSPISSTPCIKDDEEETYFPVGIQIKTSRRSTSKSRRDDECSLDSPAGTKTPSLVARLMGLDLLPGCTSPSISSGPRVNARLHPNLLRSINGARSLPETPRVSLARKSDAEYHHTPRLSLQINKENISREFEFSEKLRPQPRDENASPGSSARHFVEQVKDRVSRRRGIVLVDITNHRYRDQTRTRRRDENLIPVKAKPTKIAKSGSKNGVITPLQEQRINQKFGSGEKGKKKSTTKIKSKRTPLLIDPNPLQVKKDPSPPPTKLPPKQSQVSIAFSSKRNGQLSIKQTHLYKHKILALPKSAIRDTPTCCAAALPGGATAAYGNYIRKILERARIINEANPFNSAKPIDPSIFHYLELFHPIGRGGGGNGILSHRCNRKLIFQLVNELITEISRPQFNSNSWISPINGRDGDSPLVDELCEKIGSFPAANRVAEDIDSLVERDLCESESKELLREEESVVCEIEGEIVESLLYETAAMAVRERRKKREAGGGCHVLRY